jgi:hypothetical protein
MGRPIRARARVAAILISYADRANLATCILPMAQELGWNLGQQGLVLSSFFGGYAVTQVRGRPGVAPRRLCSSFADKFNSHRLGCTYSGRASLAAVGMIVGRQSAR